MLWKINHWLTFTIVSCHPGRIHWGRRMVMEFGERHHQENVEPKTCVGNPLRQGVWRICGSEIPSGNILVSK